MWNHCTTQYFSNHDSNHTANSGIISQHPSAPSLREHNNVFAVLLMSQANWLKKFNLLISAQSTVQQSQLNEEFAIEYDDFKVTALWKFVRKAVMSDGKVTVTALTFQWWGPNYNYWGLSFFKFSIPFFLSFTRWKTNVNFDLFLAHGFQNNSKRLLTLFVSKERDITFPK